MKKSVFFVSISILVVSLIVLITLMLSNNLITFDDFIYKLITCNKSSVLTNIMKIITTMGSAYVVIGITLLALLFIKNRKYGLLISGNLITIFLINYFIKIIVRRARPLDIALVTESGYSFPSAHAMVSCAFYGLIIYMIYHNIKNTKLKWLSISLLCLLIIFIGISRVYLGVHFASDVMAGFLFALIYLIIFINFNRKLLLFIYNKSR